MCQVETTLLPARSIGLWLGVSPKDDSETAVGSSVVREVQEARVCKRETVSMLLYAGPIFSTFALHSSTTYISLLLA